MSRVRLDDSLPLVRSRTGRLLHPRLGLPSPGVNLNHGTWRAQPIKTSDPERARKVHPYHPLLLGTKVVPRKSVHSALSTSTLPRNLSPPLPQELRPWSKQKRSRRARGPHSAENKLLQWGPDRPPRKARDASTTSSPATTSTISFKGRFGS